MMERDKREQVIKALEEVIAEAVYPDRPRKFMMSLELAEDALALPKAQEPVPIVPIRRSAHAQGANDVWYECGKCGKFLGVNPYSKQFCANCGMKVKWK